MTSKKRTSIPAKILLLAMTLMGVVGVTAAQSSGDCFEATLPFAVVLPDGTEFAGGSFKICMERILSPVSQLHVVYLDGFPSGMLISRPLIPEGSSRIGPPLFVFGKRASDGEFSLEAVVVPEGDQMVNYLFPRAGAPKAPGRFTRAEKIMLQKKADLDFLEKMEDGSFTTAMAR